jgi:hypothetical protein
LIIAWFATPWRLAYRLGGRIATPLAARQPGALLAVVVLTAFIIAISQAIRHGEWSSAAFLSALALCPVISPIADAAISRASEHGADRYAAQIGYNKALALALRTTQVADASQPRHPLLRDHPAIDRRLRRLEAASGQAGNFWITGGTDTDHFRGQVSTHPIWGDNQPDPNNPTIPASPSDPVDIGIPALPHSAHYTTTDIFGFSAPGVSASVQVAYRPAK